MENESKNQQQSNPQQQGQNVNQQSSQQQQTPGNPGAKTARKGTSSRGFASMDPAAQREIARKGGEAVSQDRAHMAEIGRRGGEAGGHRRSAQVNNQGNNNPAQR